MKCIVITGEGAAFCGGADVLEMEMGVRMGVDIDLAPMHRVMNKVEACSKPVVAAINGVALGGGCELSMACHWRVAVSTAKLGLPEVNLGILPGAQGTQRLPRLVPLEAALEMLLGGQAMPAEKAKRIGLIDEVVQPQALKGKSFVDVCAAFALRAKVRPTRAFPVKAADKVKLYGGALDMALVSIDKFRRGSPAPDAIATCVRAAFTMQFDEACKVEIREFMKLLHSMESKASRHLFFSERLSARIDGVGKDVVPLKVKKVGIIGAGLMGGGIAICFLDKKVPVVILDSTPEFLQKGVAGIRNIYFERYVARKKMTAEKAEETLANLKPTTKYEDLRDCDIVIEAVFEDMRLKQDIFRKLDAVCKPEAILCSNTSSLDVDQIAAVTSRPSKVMGMHFFSPANVMKLLENVRTKSVSPETLLTVTAAGKLIGKIPVLVGNCDGFVGNRMIGPYAAEARQLMEEGANPIDIDEALVQFGFAMGPVSMGDLVGYEVFWKMRKSSGNMALETNVAYGPHELTDWMCEKQFFGQKTGKGFFLYDTKTGRKLGVNKEAVKGIAEVQAKKRIVPRKISREEIVCRCVYPLINEGFKILQDGIAQRPSDIDVVYVFGYGFPPLKGGPMFFADNILTLPKLLEGLAKYQKQSEALIASNSNYKPRPYWKPATLLQQCVKENVKLEDMWRKLMKRKTSKASDKSNL